jgi:Xaa-Pro aminopeptidase
MHSMMYFPAEEYAERVRRARELMEEQGIDALVATAPNNITYISGYRTNLFDSNFRPYFAVIPRESDAVLLLPSLESGVGQETSWIVDQPSWGPNEGDIAPDGFSAIVLELGDKGLTKGKLAIERGFGQRIGMHLDAYLDLEARLPDVEWVDATPVFWKLRGLKSAAEVANLRKAAEITDAAYEKVLSSVHEGMSEREIQSIMGQEYMRLGSDYRGFIIVNGGKQRYKMMNPYASDYRLRRGDMCNIDFGAVYDGYWCDLTRGFFVGEASDRQREFYEVAKAASAAAVAAVQPGVACEEIDLVAERYLVDAGYKEYMLHRTGHSIGLEIHELPSIGLGEKTVLQPNMVVAIEPGIYDFNIGGFRMEDIVLVTETGSEYLSNCQRELTIV